MTLNEHLTSDGPIHDTNFKNNNNNNYYTKNDK